MSNFVPTGSQALMHFADTLDQQAARLDRLLWRDRGQRSTTAEACQSQGSRLRTIIMIIGQFCLQIWTGPLELPPFTFSPRSLLQGAI
jgi:replicative DNA helicase